MIRPLLLLLLALGAQVSAQNIGYLSEHDTLPFYGGYVWDYEMGQIEGDQILFVSMSGGDGIYYARFPKGQRPRQPRWQKLGATQMGGSFHFPATAKMRWHEGSKRLYFIHDLDLYSAPLQGAAQFHYFCNDFLLLGDTLISTSIINSERQFIRSVVGIDGHLEEIDHQAIDLPFGGNYRFSHDPKTDRIVFWGDSLVISTEPYYATQALNYQKRSLNLDLNTITSIIYHIDQSGTWHALGSQNYGSWLHGPPDTSAGNSPKPRLWFSSKDQGHTWQSHEINRPWPLQFLMPPEMSSARDRYGQHIIAGSLYYSAHRGWQEIGRLYRSRPGLFVYDGTSFFHPQDPSIAFHASNFGPAMSTHYGDSLFLISEGIVASPMSDFYFERRARAIVAASEQQVALVQEVGTPYESWQYFPNPVNYGSPQQVAYDAEYGRLYSASDQKLYRLDLSEGKWHQILDPQSDLGHSMSWAHDICDIAIDPLNAKHLALLVEHYSPYYRLLYSFDAGNTWDTLLIEVGRPILGHLKWFAAADGSSRLYLSQQNRYFSNTPHLFYYRFKDSSSPQLIQDSLPGYSYSGDRLVQYDQIPNSERKVALTTMGSKDRLVDFTLAIQRENLAWDTLQGEWVEDCYGCYSFPSSVAAHKDFVFVGVGHWLYMYQISYNQFRYVGRRPGPLARGENNRHLQFLKDDLYIGGAYGLYHQHLTEYERPSFPMARWNFYPNPSAGLLRIQPPAPVEVFDLNGQRVYQSPHPEHEIDLRHLKLGVYLIRHPNGGLKRFLKVDR